MVRWASVFIVAAIGVGALVGVEAAWAVPPMRVTGGGTGTFDADLDGDGDLDGSAFGLGVVLSAGGLAEGHFQCLMAGRSDILGLHLMQVAGRVDSGHTNPDGSASFSGTATVNLGGGEIIPGIPFTVMVTPGGAGVGTLQLTVIGAFDGAPGDVSPGNGNYDLPVETVRSGGVRVG
jgi:hypothetical protein